MNENIININNISELEHAFSEDFGTPLFPVLANHYLINKEMKRSRKVCDLGLKNSPYNSDGKFILAKLNLYENKLMKGEQLLKQVVNENPVHINGLRILIEVMRALNRSPNSVKKYIQRILHVLPDDEDSLALLSTLDSSSHVKIKAEKPKPSKNNNEKVVTLPPKETSKPNPIVSSPENLVFDVGMSMATFTMVGVLKSQKNYKQALAVLNRLHEKNADPQRLASERETLEKLLATE